MHVLLTGATGYIGRRLLPELLDQGHRVTALVRDAARVSWMEPPPPGLKLLVGDLLEPESLPPFPEDVEIAFFLVHAMGTRRSGFDTLEARTAETFTRSLASTRARQVIYLSGLVNDRELSPHLKSRLHVETILAQGRVPLTVLRAGVIIGSGSASFEMIRDLVEKLPVMITPRWVTNRCQPTAIRDVLFYLQAVMDDARFFGKTFDIGGPDVLTYRAMMLGYARIRGLRRWMIPVPVLTPRLSSYWLYFITSTTFNLAYSLVSSLKNEAVCAEQEIQKLLPHACMPYDQAVEAALNREGGDVVASSWKDSAVSTSTNTRIADLAVVPVHGVCVDRRAHSLSNDREAILRAIWSLGGQHGWAYANWAWKLRGFADKLVGGVGLRRGRRDPQSLKVGDALDFWRVVKADPKSGHLILFAEMRLPGEAWLEFKIHQDRLQQTATFRPRGLFGRLYWWSLWPMHQIIFRGMIRRLARARFPARRK